MEERSHNCWQIVALCLALLLACGGPAARAAQPLSREQLSRLRTALKAFKASEQRLEHYQRGEDDPAFLKLLPDLGPAITQRLEKARADLKRQLEAAGLKAEPAVAIKRIVRGLRPDLDGEIGYGRWTAPIEVDEADLEGLEHYAKGEYDQASVLFQKSLAAKPSKEFPAYFLGCIAFEQHDYPQAAKRFQAVYVEDKHCPSARFLSILSGLCARHAQPVAPTDLVLLAMQAAVRENKEDDPSALPGETGPAYLWATLSEEAMVARVCEAALPVAVECTAGLAAQYAREADPRKQAALALMVKDKATRDALLALVAQKHPDDPDLANLAFMARFFKGPDSITPLKDSPRFDRDLAAAIRRDPGNGALPLTQVGMKGPSGPYSGKDSPENMKYVLLTAAETDLLHRAASAREFNAYQGFEESLRQSYGLRKLGGLALLVRPREAMPYTPWHNAMIRAWVTMRDLAKRDGEVASLRLYDDALVFAERIQRSAPDDVLPSLVADALREGACATVYGYASGAGDGGILDRATKVWSQAIEQDKVLQVASRGLVVLNGDRIPLPSLQQAQRKADSPAGLEALYKRLIREDHDAYLKQALSQYAHIHKADVEEKELAQEHPEDKRFAQQGSYRGEYTSMAALLGDLGDPKGVPALKQMSASKDPLVAYMAKQALGKIEAAQKGAQSGGAE